MLILYQDIRGLMWLQKSKMCEEFFRSHGNTIGFPRSGELHKFHISLLQPTIS